MPRPLVAMVAAMAQNTASGASFMTEPVTRGMTWDRPSTVSSTILARAPMAAQATPKKMENTTICRISLSTIGRTALSGKTCLMKPSSVMAWLSMPELTPLTTLWTPAPGSKMLTRIRPRLRDTREALTNHSMALPPTRPTAPVSAMWPMPTTRVENTRGPMMILISRRKTMLPMEI